MREADVFIVHLWIADGAQRAFRAAVQRAGTDESTWFTEAQALTRYFEQQGTPRRAANATSRNDPPAGGKPK